MLWQIAHTYSLDIDTVKKLQQHQNENTQLLQTYSLKLEEAVQPSWSAKVWLVRFSCITRVNMAL
jgi:hypothetical protein